jgi:hypothetical protein
LHVVSDIGSAELRSDNGDNPACLYYDDHDHGDHRNDDHHDELDDRHDHHVDDRDHSDVDHDGRKLDHYNAASGVRLHRSPGL